VRHATSKGQRGHPNERLLWFVTSTSSLTDKYYIRRFLRARQHDLPRAKHMYAEHVQWRREFKVAEIVKDFNFHERDMFLTLYPQGYHKTDKLVRTPPPTHTHTNTHLPETICFALCGIIMQECIISGLIEVYPPPPPHTHQHPPLKLYSGMSTHHD